MSHVVELYMGFPHVGWRLCMIWRHAKHKTRQQTLSVVGGVPESAGLERMSTIFSGFMGIRRQSCEIPGFVLLSLGFQQFEAGGST